MILDAPFCMHERREPRRLLFYQTMHCEMGNIAIFQRRSYLVFSCIRPFEYHTLWIRSSRFARLALGGFQIGQRGERVVVEQRVADGQDLFVDGLTFHASFRDTTRKDRCRWRIRQPT